MIKNPLTKRHLIISSITIKKGEETIILIKDYTAVRSTDKSAFEK